ncbi:MAG TPA: type II toxin-antitoxin system VapC family toxin [Kiritimatiellia bacterium]|nr:type II toxin-antitoxin system VapC family toxin [Kiritimatiellia bacterium]
MAWVVDSCVILDVALGESAWSIPSARLLDRFVADGLVACPVSMVEIAPYFDGDVDKEQVFLDLIDIRHDWDWLPEDTETAAGAWARQVYLKREKKVGKRPVADILIGAFAMRAGGLLTRNACHFKTVFPGLRIEAPVLS